MDDFRIADCVVRPSEHLIERDGQATRIEPRAMALLGLLAGRAGRVVTRQEIEEGVWAGRVVGYEALTQTVAKLRRALGDDGRDARIIVTVPKEGYKLAVPLAPLDMCDAVVPLPGPDAPTDGPQGGPAHAGKRLWWAGAVAAAAGMAVAAWAWTQWPGRASESAAVAVSSAAPATRPSLAVLPFANLSDGGGDGYLADGLTEDLTTSLTHFPEMFVIALNSAQAFKGKPVNVDEIRRALGVRYLIHGSVQAGGDRVRVNAQLVDTETDAHLWAQKYDRPRGDLFEVQDELVNAIASRILPHVQEAEKRRARLKPTESLDAYDLFQRARSEKHKLNGESEARAVELLKDALALDPNFAEARVLLGWAGGLQRLFSGQGPSFEESLASIQRGIELNPTLSVGYQALAQILSFMGRHDEAANAGRRAIALNPNDAENHIMFSRAASTAGYYAEAVRSAEAAVALNPLYPKWYPFIYSRALYANGQGDRAAEICIDGMARQAFVPTAVTCVAVLARLGRLDEAGAMAARLKTMAPALTLEQAMLSWGYRDETLNERFRQDLRSAGFAG